MRKTQKPLLLIIVVIISICLIFLIRKPSDKGDGSDTSEEPTSSETESEPSDRSEKGKTEKEEKQSDVEIDPNAPKDPVDRAEYFSNLYTVGFEASDPKAAVTFGGHGYVLFNFRGLDLAEDYNAWETFCESMGGHLAVINDKQENEFLYNYIRDQRNKKGERMRLAFFGYSNQTGTWKWVYGDSTYTNWSKVNGQPNDNKGEDYAQFYEVTADGTWNNARIGSNSYWFLCEWE